MLALCLMLSATYYVQNYAGIIGLGLTCEACFIHHKINITERETFSDDMLSKI